MELYESMLKRIEAAFNAKGRHTQYSHVMYEQSNETIDTNLKKNIEVVCNLIFSLC